MGCKKKGKKSKTRSKVYECVADAVFEFFHAIFYGQDPFDEKAMPFKKKGSKKAPKLGSGGRFKLCIQQVMNSKWGKQRGIDRKKASAVCAKIGRKKFGKKRFGKLASAGK